MLDLILAYKNQQGGRSILEVMANPEPAGRIDQCKKCKEEESKGQKKSFYRKVLRIIDDATNLVNTKASRMKKRAGFFKVMVVLPNCVCR